MTSIFDIFQLIATNAWLYGGTFILVLSLLVFVHEFGHYSIARLCGVRVETFSIGFGKELLGWTDSHGTRWKLSLVPLGGYVKMFGDTDPASAGNKAEVETDGGAVRPMTAEERNVAFFAKPVAQRAAIVFAGPAINFIFAVLLLAGLYMTMGQPVSPPLASAVIEDSAAAKAGFRPHDRIVAIDGNAIRRFEEIRLQVSVALDTPMDFTVERDGKEINLTATPVKEVKQDRFGFSHSQGMLGIIGPAQGLLLKNIVAVNGRKTSDEAAVRKAILPLLGKSFTITLKRNEEQNDVLRVNPDKELNAGLLDDANADFGTLLVAQKTGDEIVHHGLIGGISAAMRETYDISASTLTALGQMITGTRSATELGGIIRIGAIAGDMAQSGILALITFTALLSINLGLINLFPIPMLDGGHLVFYAIEAIKGKPIPEQIQEYAFRLGLAVLVGIMLFANLNDIVQLIL